MGSRLLISHAMKFILISQWIRFALQPSPRRFFFFCFLSETSLFTLQRTMSKSRRVRHKLFLIEHHPSTTVIHPKRYITHQHPCPSINQLVKKVKVKLSLFFVCRIRFFVSADGSGPLFQPFLFMHWERRWCCQSTTIHHPSTPHPLDVPYQLIKIVKLFFLCLPHSCRARR